MKVKFKKWLAACIVSMGIVCSTGATAFAYTGEGTPPEQGTETPTPIPEQTPSATGGADGRRNTVFCSGEWADFGR
mgnify:CR=1 FL=1